MKKLAFISALFLSGCILPLRPPPTDPDETQLPSVEVVYAESFEDGRNKSTVVHVRNAREDSFRSTGSRFGCSGRFNNASRLIAGGLGLPPDFFNNRNGDFRRSGASSVIARQNTDAEWRVYSRDSGGIKSIRVEVIRTFRGLNDGRIDIDPLVSTSDPEARVFNSVNQSGHNIVVIEREFTASPLSQFNGLFFKIDRWTSDFFQIFVEDGNGQMQRVNMLWLPSEFCLGRRS